MTQWSPQQAAALKAVDHWYRNDRHKKQVFYIAGCAGTGKTTLARHFAEGIGGTVKFATFTGKAAHVMATKGCAGASTIHQLIYRPKVASKTRLKALEKELSDLEQAPQPWEKPFSERVRKAREEVAKERENAGRMSFSLNLESDLRFAKLLILDECSMVDRSIGKDLESFNIPILVLGDPEQLPPIYGAGHFTEKTPDIFLDEIHRQALDNPIIAMSKTVRENGVLTLGNYGQSRVVSEKLENEDIMGHDIMLVGLRKTKKACDDKYRSITERPVGIPKLGDRIMCVKNNHSMGLLNGQIWEVLEDAVDMGGGIVSIFIRDEYGTELAVSCAEKLFYGQQLQRWEHEDDIQEFEYAYAITVHKSQGSQWNDVLLFDQKDRFPAWTEKDRRRWLYTGITRAAERITVMRL